MGYERKVSKFEMIKFITKFHGDSYGSKSTLYKMKGNDLWSICKQTNNEISQTQKTIDGYAFDVAKEWDWTVKKWEPSKETYDEYECSCLDVGHDNRLEVCEIVKERLIRDGHLSSDDNKYDDYIDECVWNYISNAILTNMTPNA